jgi:hypothetical protein
MEHPDHPIGNMYLPSKVFMALTDHAGEGYYGPKCEAALCALIRQWVASTPAAHCPWRDVDDEEGDDELDYSAAEEPPAAAASAASTSAATTSAATTSAATASATIPPAAPASRGYQWKDLFLPNGTELRAIYCGRSTYATVEDEKIISDDGPTTPSRLANRQGCGTRNAWQTVWLRMPGSTRWQRAADCRRLAG